MTENTEKLTFSECLLKETKIMYSGSFKYVGYLTLCLISVVMVYFGYIRFTEFLIKNLSPIVSFVPYYVYVIILIVLIPVVAAFGKCISRHTNIATDDFHMISIIISMVVYLIALIIPLSMGMNAESTLHKDQFIMLIEILIVPWVLCIYGSEIAFGTYLLLCDKKE
jgi:uncharacterized membrane protein